MGEKGTATCLPVYRNHESGGRAVGDEVLMRRVSHSWEVLDMHVELKEVKRKMYPMRKTRSV